MKSVEGESQSDPPRQKCYWLLDGWMGAGGGGGDGSNDNKN